MSSIFKKFMGNQPPFIKDNLMFEVLMGSHAYGCNTPESDKDVYGVCIPPKVDIFPHLRGEIPGFGTQKNRFDVFQAQHAMVDGEEVDFQIYSIVRYFHLCMGGNPNMIDSLFVPERCVIHTTRIGEMLRENRKLFLSQKILHSYSGYAHGQMKQIESRSGTQGKRKALIEKYGYDVKFAYHLVRLLLQCEQALTTGDMDLERDAQKYCAIRRGEYTLEELRKWYDQMDLALHTRFNPKDGRVAETCAVPYAPDEERIKELLLNCLEEHYGSLSAAIVLEDEVSKKLGAFDRAYSELRKAIER